MISCGWDVLLMKLELRMDGRGRKKLGGLRGGIYALRLASLHFPRNTVPAALAGGLAALKQASLPRGWQKRSTDLHGSDQALFPGRNTGPWIDSKWKRPTSQSNCVALQDYLSAGASVKRLAERIDGNR